VELDSNDPRISPDRLIELTRVAKEHQARAAIKAQELECYAAALREDLALLAAELESLHFLLTAARQVQMEREQEPPASKSE
jgi:hypothetical protein